jgi:hypothetical protein
MTHVSAQSRAIRWWSQVRLDTGADTVRVVPIAVVLIVAQLLYRAWASYGSYWAGDDFIFINQTFGAGGRSLDALVTGLAGHVMPAGLYLSWLVNRVAPYDFGLATVVLTLLQAAASLGLLRFLLVAFGRRWGILPPLVVYLATAITVQGAVWWGPGIHALPFQIAFFLSMTSQVLYLRTRRAHHALAACGWVVFGLCFYEKSVLIIGALAIVTVAYFTVGTLRERLLQVWVTYRVSVLANLVLGAAYLAAYVAVGLSFSPGQATNYPIGPTADVMVLRSWATGILGGPLQWSHVPNGPLSFAAPNSLLVIACWIALGLLVRELVRSRSRSLRALWLPGYFLACDVLLVVASRAALVGPGVGYEFRYIEEMSAVTAVALGLATMPLRGALERVEVTRPSPLLDRRRSAATACVVVAVLGTWSSFTYFHIWHSNQPAKQFFTTLFDDARHRPPGTLVVDEAVPSIALAPLSSPYNRLSRLLRPLPQRLEYTDAATDHLLYPAPDGHLGQIDVTPVHHALPRPGKACGYRVGTAMREIPLDGPFLYGSWWVRVRYIATADTAITVQAGGLTHHTAISAGLHTLYFRAGEDRFDSLQMGGVVRGAHLCTDDVTVGRAVVRGSAS